jgi:hypothetical protein
MVIDANISRIAAMLAQDSATINLSNRICNVANKLLGADGSSLSILLSNYLTSNAATDSEYAFFDEQQLTFADGPTFDASKSLEPISAHNFRSDIEIEKWPIFSPIASARGLVSMVAYPMRVATSNLGVLSGYRKTENEISNKQFVDGVALSTLSTSLIVQELAGKIETSSQEIVGPVSMDQSLIHFAAGKVAEHYNLSTLESLVRIRAQAYKSELPITEIASQIANGNLEIVAEEKK